MRLEWLARETILSGRGGGIVAALRECEWVERQRMAEASAVDDRPACNDARQNIVCISVFLEDARVEPAPGLVSVLLSGEVIALLRRGLLRELASAAREVSQAVSRGGYDRDPVLGAVVFRHGGVVVRRDRCV
ncbi:MAG TPA: hypothetical protein VK756_09545 [Solirubrobacteraceae bacterium]|nr:hypothetical protein [Solirubrobacteraceae bacterium]